MNEFMIELERTRNCDEMDKILTLQVTSVIYCSKHRIIIFI